jgi:hypothetical protein
MTVPAQVSVYAQVFVPREYEVFAGLDVDHHSIAGTFTDHDRLMQSLRLPYSAPQLLNYVRKHFPQQRLAFVYEAGPIWICVPREGLMPMCLLFSPIRLT